MSKVIEKKDDRGNLIYHKDSNGTEYWWDHDKSNNMIHGKNSKGCEIWQGWDERNRRIYYKTDTGYEQWYKYDEEGREIDITELKLKERGLREQEKEFLNRESVPRFELMEL